MSRKLWKHRITDILDSIRKIQKYVEALKFDDFRQDEKAIDAVIRNFIVIGEAARNIPEDVSSKYPNIPWRLMGDMRNRIDPFMQGTFGYWINPPNIAFTK
jgi:uncharacterized protein with HEPN domain